MEPSLMLVQSGFTAVLYYKLKWLLLEKGQYILIFLVYNWMFWPDGG